MINYSISKLIEGSFLFHKAIHIIFDIYSLIDFYSAWNYLPERKHHRLAPAFRPTLVKPSKFKSIVDHAYQAQHMPFSFEKGTNRPSHTNCIELVPNNKYPPPRPAQTDIPSLVINDNNHVLSSAMPCPALLGVKRWINGSFNEVSPNRLDCPAKDLWVFVRHCPFYSHQKSKENTTGDNVYFIFT